jgi:GNAT superfamily N-acetyltransferase
MELVPITCSDDITNPFIRERALTSSKSKHTQHYVAKENGCQLGFLSIDRIPDANYLVLYEIFVPKNLRHQGIASRLLLDAERLAKDFGYELIVLNPSPFESDYPMKKLVSWYKRLGYRKRRGSSGDLEKCIV